MKTLNIGTIADNKQYNIIKDCLNLGMRVYITTSGSYTNEYFFVSDKEQEYFAYYQTGASCNFHMASTSTRHKPNRNTGTGYQLYTEDIRYDAKKRDFVETTYAIRTITAEHIKKTLEQSKNNILSGKEQKTTIKDVFWSDDSAEVILK